MHLPAAAPLWIGVVLTAIVAIADGELGPRKNLADLSPDELTRFRDAVRTLQQNGQWVAVAGDHGVPHSFCPHGSKKFLPWHRRFIARLEIALGVPLPYWDWTTGPIPQALLDATYVDAQGNVQANPLLAGPKAGDPFCIVRTTTSTLTNWVIAGDGMTKRDMNADFPFKSLADQEALTITRESFEEMSAALEGAHNDVHGSVGGDSTFCIGLDRRRPVLSVFVFSEHARLLCVRSDLLVEPQQCRSYLVAMAAGQQVRHVPGGGTWAFAGCDPSCGTVFHAG